MTRLCANLNFLFTELPFLDRFDAAADAGFQGVEFAFPYPYDAHSIRERIDRNQLTLVMFNAPPGNWDAGERGLACLPERRADFEASIAVAIDYAKTLGVSKLHCMAGIIDNDIPVADTQTALLSNLRFAAQAFNAENIQLLIEPINTRDMPGYAVTHTKRAIELIQQIGPDGVGLQFDAYHMQIMEGDISRTIEHYLPFIQHIQIADNPGRHEPGTGEINIEFLLRHLDAIGYSGWVGCEYHPSNNTQHSLQWLATIPSNIQPAAG